MHPVTAVYTGMEIPGTIRYMDSSGEVVETVKFHPGQNYKWVNENEKLRRIPVILDLNSKNWDWRLEQSVAQIWVRIFTLADHQVWILNFYLKIVWSL